MLKFSQHLSSVFIAVLCFLQLYHNHHLFAEAQSTTVRPYQFGFTIDEQQHRYEKRDERGIVMGEFGFITADGIYHVTVYATDEEGRFRILAMKNYPYEAKPKTFEIMMTPKTSPTTTTTTMPKPTLPRQNFYNEACSGCFLSNGNGKAKSPGETAVKTDIRPLSKPLSKAGATSTKTNTSPNSGTQPKSSAGSSANQPKPVAGKPATGPQTTKLVHSNYLNKNNHPMATHLHQTVPLSEGHKEITTFDKTQTQSNSATSQTLTSTLINEAKTLAGSSGFQHHTHSATNTPKVDANLSYTQTPTTSSLITTTKPTTPQTKTSILINEAMTLAGSTGFQYHTSPHSATNARKDIPHPSHTQKPTTTGNTGFTHTSPSSSHVTNPYKPETESNNGVPNQQTQSHSSNPQNNPNLGTAQTNTPTIQPNIMDVIVNKVLPSVMGSKGVVAKPTTTTASSGRSPANSLIPNGKSGSTNPTYGKANSNPQYKPSAGGSTLGDDGDLYRFKYNLDYHGHKETGKRNGNKEGNYYAIGDDDIERTVEYVANENGYQPRIHWRKLNNPVAAKENTLKDYEFVWFTLN